MPSARVGLEALKPRDFHSTPTGASLVARATPTLHTGGACCRANVTCCLTSLTCRILISSNYRPSDTVCSSSRNFFAGLSFIGVVRIPSCPRHNSNANRHQERCPAAPGRRVVAGNVLPACLAAPASAAPPQDVFGDDERSCGVGGAVEEASTKDNGDATWDDTV